jgi:hypothetical protein
VTLKLGEIIPRGKRARTGLYAILDTRRDKILRVALSQEVAEILCDYQSRYVREAFLAQVETETVPGSDSGTRSPDVV